MTGRLLFSEMRRVRRRGRQPSGQPSLVDRESPLDPP